MLATDAGPKRIVLYLSEFVQQCENCRLIPLERIATSKFIDAEIL